MARSKTPAFAIALLVATACAVVFAIFGGLSNGFTPKNIAGFAAFGAIIGAVAAPYIEPESFKYPITWQVCCSVLGCLLVALYLRAGLEGYALAAMVGVILGYTAPYWVKHIQAP
ncbi:hypothetical protein E5198_14000 [Pseudomonas sp. A-1]|uniref:hypothetical protein n=1 Tax=unclassified Pseudomonas TaxID=196821 RepID=UPI0010A6927A|nr:MULTISPECIES: hypothetical protein [unclassified Pseudomonas]THG80077.1 hypothetical protein E5198_14000 [Pseudomonas sp. A-1]WPP45811.1 hypothetical protein SK095_21635 [Pseudomonas sp. AN-1]